MPPERRFDLRLSLASEEGLYFEKKESLLEHLYENNLVLEEEPLEEMLAQNPNLQLFLN